MSADTKGRGVLAVLDDAIADYTDCRFKGCHGTGPGLTAARAAREARSAIAELIETGDCVVKAISVAELVKPSNKNPNAGFVDMRAWYALQGEVTHLIAALARVQGGAK